MGIGCCGATWGTRRRRSSTTINDEVSLAPIPIESVEVPRSPYRPEEIITICNGTQTTSVMNLAAALAAEREVRAGQEFVDGDRDGDGIGGTGFVVQTLTPSRVSLMRLLEESDGVDKEMEGCDSVCCVCMGRKKDAAFIPCGHTFCRVCSRELWLNRGSCPLCNRLIIEILDIF